MLKQKCQFISRISTNDTTRQKKQKQRNEKNATKLQTKQRLEVKQVFGGTGGRATPQRIDKQPENKKR
jgi:hypothetical protein